MYESFPGEYPSIIFNKRQSHKRTMYCMFNFLKLLAKPNFWFGVWEKKE